MAHRAGNDVGRFLAAGSWGVRLVEADVRLFRGRAEVRHLKSLGPLPIYWDRWRLASPFTRTPRLDELLGAAPPEPELLLDLKGRNALLARLVLDALALHPTRPVTICARSWNLLDAFEDRPNTRLIYSIGTARQLRAFCRRFADGGAGGVAVHAGLLDAATVRELRDRAAVVMSWPVNTAARARELVTWGVEGLISDRPRALAAPAGMLDRTGR